jgi:hypothetical protein
MRALQLVIAVFGGLCAAALLLVGTVALGVTVRGMEHRMSRLSDESKNGLVGSLLFIAAAVLVMLLTRFAMRWAS